MRRHTLAFLACVLSLVMSTAVPAQEDGQTPDAETPPKPVKLMTLSSEPVTVTRQFFGQVAARQTVDLAFQVPGKLEMLNAEEGARKAEGAEIAQLDLSGYERAVAEAEANFDKAQRDADRLESLRGQAVSEVQVQDAQTQLRLAEIALNSAREDLEHATLRAPFDALIAKRLVANFQTVQAGTPVVRLHDVSEIRVDIQVPEVLFRKAGADDDVAFHAELPGDGRRYELALREFETETSATGQTYTITLAFIENPGAFVFPGASVTVYTAVEGPEQTGVILPETALVYDPEGNAQVMVFEDGKVTARAVKIEVHEDSRIYMTEGPADGTRIVETGAAQLRDGQSARPFTRVGE
ncbi:Solvent efflux pump periplasmic linker SrpA precursor [Roseovarius sp. THAF9]|uniref:efflux RND transporter periplasmic adaptor subunit n=1 Tax=Roseovarius sp. THAF9 TaxID=2587847 RepID=UPI0012693CB8|nr:efflux RND transporter periplasmic adaptor subunit [Roseovarius sp. THAF9]QFT93189.1 Solvent efflux pump periplasmic linker SrpA precursor [Roseovarius sp. THAF9]